jgi:Undecaprenyl-phosphate glucose phosphotransferase
MSSPTVVRAAATVSGSSAGVPPIDRNAQPCPDRRCFSPSPEIVVGVARIADLCLVAIAAVVAFGIHIGDTLDSPAERERYFLTALVAAAIFVAGTQYIGGYTLKQLSALCCQLTRAAATWAITISALGVLAWVADVSERYSHGWTLSWTMMTLAFILLERGIVRFAIARWVRDGHLARNVAIVGAGEDVERLVERLRKSQDQSIAIRGIFDDLKSRAPLSVCGSTALGTTDDLLDFARQVPIQEVIIALPLTAEERLKKIVGKLKPLAADLRLSAAPIIEELQVRHISYIGDVPLLNISDRPIKNWHKTAKYIEDKMLAILLLLVFGPVMVVVALLIKLDSRGPVFFVQERFGCNNNPIRVVKFRTMYTESGDVSGAQRTVRSDPRVTRVGRVLRELSFDELPQLFNVLKNDMSLVGPRPHAIAMKAGNVLYCDAIEEYAQRHRVKPGITGWAQVNRCRGEIDTIAKAQARLDYDLYYIEHWSLWLDLKILARTVPTLLSRQNAY